MKPVWWALLLVVGCAPAREPSAPSAPVLTAEGTAPEMLRRRRTVTVKAMVDVADTVRLFASRGCLGPEVLRAPAARFLEGVEVPVVPFLDNVFAAQAISPRGLQSACSNEVTVVVGAVDFPVLTAPELTRVSPGSPTNASEVRVFGLVADGATVRVYGEGRCAGSRLAEGSSAAFADAGLLVPVKPDGLTVFTADARLDDLISSCSANALQVVNDTTPPTPTTGWVLPSTPSAERAPLVVLTALNATGFLQWRGDGCAGEPERQVPCESAVFSRCVQVFRVPAVESATVLSCLSTDAAGNRSACVSLGVPALTQTPAPSVVLHFIPEGPTGPGVFIGSGREFAACLRRLATGDPWSARPRRAKDCRECRARPRYGLQRSMSRYIPSSSV
jgi:hypothetical protein